MDYISSVVLYPGHLIENGKVEDGYQSETGWNIEKNNCPIVQHFSYKCQRNRNDAGIPYGSTIPTELKFTILLGSSKDSKQFYQQLTLNELFEHTFIFNPSFDDSSKAYLKYYEDAMIVKGYVVDVDEDFDTKGTDDNEDNLIQIEVTLLLSSITYQGREEKINRKLEITNY